MVMFLDIIWWMGGHWIEIIAGVLVLDKVVAATPNRFDDVILTFVKWVIRGVKYLKDEIKSYLMVGSR